MKYIPLSSCDEMAMVDDEDFARCFQHRWFLDKGGFPAMTPERDRRIRLSAFVLGIERGSSVIHKDRNKFNSQKDNLRATDRSAKAQVAPKRSTNTSGYKGVSFHKQAKKWVSVIGNQGYVLYLGIFKTKEEAAKAYDLKALELYGEHADFNLGKPA